MDDASGLKSGSKGWLVKKVEELYLADALEKTALVLELLLAATGSDAVRKELAGDVIAATKALRLAAALERKVVGPLAVEEAKVSFASTPSMPGSRCGGEVKGPGR